MPREVRSYTVGLLAAGLAAAVVIATPLPVSPIGTGLLVALAVTALVAVWVPLRFEHRGHIQGFTLEEGVFVALLLTLPTGVAPIIITAAAAVAHAARRPGPEKVAFNVGQVGLWTSAGALVFALAGGQPSFTVRSLLAAIAAVIVANVVSIAALAELFHRLAGRPRPETLRDVWRLNAVTALGNTSFGLILAILAGFDPLAVALASVLMVGLYLGYRGYVGVLDEQRRVERLHTVTTNLAHVTAESEALSTFLQDLCDLFQADRAEILLLTDGRQVAATLTAGGLDREREPSPVVLDVLAGPARSATGEGRMTTKLVDGRDTVGVVSVCDRRGLEPWDATDAKLFEAVANDAAVALRNVELFQQLELERARLEAETTKLGDIVDAASDGIVLLGRDGRIQAWNRAMEEITGTPAGDVLGHPWFVSLRVKDALDNELLPEGAHVIADAIDGHRHRDAVSLQVLRRDGVWRWLRVTFAPVLRGDAEPVGTVLVARDVTSEREVEDLKNDFVATVSHELRTPLTPLKGFLSTLAHRGHSMDPEQLEVVFDAMGSQVDRLERLIADLLIIADLDRGAVTLARANVDLAEIAAGVVAQDGHGRVALEPSEPLPALGDDGAVRRVLSALVSNALKHTEGRVTVRVEATGDLAQVHVIDEGGGIAPWEQERIFHRFHRLGDHLTRTQGPGLGLPIARALAQRMAGDVSVSSDVGRGSRFTLTLPTAGPRVIPDEPAAQVV